MRREERRERRCADEWDVAVEDENVAREALERRRGAGDGVAGAALLLLDDAPEAAKARARPQRRGPRPA
jgi:hypothetical protein